MTKLLHIPLTSIIIDREARQRKEIDVSDIIESIRARGVLTPIIVAPTADGKFKLIAGERRFTASQIALRDTIPAHLLSDLSSFEKLMIEYEENTKRKSLTWQDDVRAVMTIQNELREANSEITQVETANRIGFSKSKFNQYCLVGKNIDNPDVIKLDSFSQAHNFLLKLVERKTADAMTELLETVNETPSLNITLPAVPENKYNPALPSLRETSDEVIRRPIPSSVENIDFASWLENYSGSTFNFVHCDFPYGVNLFGGKMSGRQTTEQYDDSPKVYWDLLKIFCENLDKFMSPSAHLFFWFSMDFYSKTITFFRQNAPSLAIQSRPLVWLKSDNVGIVPDVRRQPRWITETALIGLREDRPLVKVVANGIAAPTDRKWHSSTKPEPVLRHFFQMFVDDSTKMFDPTCGSASALRAAESLGAKHVLGLEKNSDAFTNAVMAMREFRVKRKLAGDL